MKMSSYQTLDVALEILTKHYENEGNNYSRARLSAYAFLFGATSTKISNQNANDILEMVFNEYSPKEKVGA